MGPVLQLVTRHCCRRQPDRCLYCLLHHLYCSVYRQSLAVQPRWQGSQGWEWLHLVLSCRRLALKWGLLFVQVSQVQAQAGWLAGWQELPQVPQGWGGRGSRAGGQ